MARTQPKINDQDKAFSKLQADKTEGDITDQLFQLFLIEEVKPRFLGTLAPYHIEKSVSWLRVPLCLLDCLCYL